MKKTFVLLFAICAWVSAYAQSYEPELENVPMQTIPYNELYPSYIHKGPYKLKRYSDKYVNQMPEYIKEISNIVVNGIVSTSDNDDF